jgi:sec-independent protein translocase protein TatA
MFRNPTADLLVVLLIVLLIFGPKRLPGLGKTLGQGIREFKESITGKSDDDDEAARPAITQATGATTTPPATTPTSERQSAEVGSEPRS